MNGRSGKAGRLVQGVRGRNVRVRWAFGVGLGVEGAVRGGGTGSGAGGASVECSVSSTSLHRRIPAS